MTDKELEIITVNNENIDTEHICCAIGNDAKNVKRAETKKALKLFPLKLVEY